MLQGIEKLFLERDKMTYGVKKSNYDKRCDHFMDECGSYLAEMDALINEADDKEAKAKEIGEYMMDSTKNAYKNRWGKLTAVTQTEISLQLIYYVFPLILKNCENGTVIADGVLAAAQKLLKNKDLRYADYDTIKSGFQTKIFGFSGGGKRD